MEKFPFPSFWSLHMPSKFVLAIGSLILVATIALSQEPKPDNETLDGVWIAESAELAGTKLPDAVLKDWKLLLKGDAYTVTIGKQIDQGKVKVDATLKPKGIDVMGKEGPNKDKTFLAIYEFANDRLTICYDLSGESRPTEFKTKPDTKLFLAKYKRLKAE